MIAMYISRSKAALAKTVRIILFVIGGFGILLWGGCTLTQVSRENRITESNPNGDFDIAIFMTFFILTLLGVAMVATGIKNIRREKRVQFYNSIFEADNDGVVTAEELTAQTGLSVPKIIQELDQLITGGFLINCVLQRSPLAVTLTVRNEAAVQAMNAYAEHPVKCSACGGQVNLRTGQRVECPFCGGPIQG